MDPWTVLLDVLVLLSAAMVLGAIADRLGQSPIVGYLLAGAVLGPNALNLLPSHAAVTGIAELGVALLLFTIGLEFSWRRLRAIGAIALGGGTLQVVGTAAVGTAVALAAGLGTATAIAIGAMIPLSSTAAVVRLLAARGEVDAIHGRNAVGILLLQDVAVVPLVLLVAVMGEGGSLGQMGVALGRAAILAVALMAGLYLVLNHVMPLLLRGALAGRNRDLSILLAVVTAVGAAWVSHAFGLSPVLGAFVAGMLLAESPFAAQLRADVVPLQTLFMTLFFSAIGMLANPAWATQHWTLLLMVVTAVVVGKAVLTAAAARILGVPTGLALATGLVLAQVGEFSLVLAGVARNAELLDGDLFDLIVATLTVTLFLTPYLAALAPWVARRAARPPAMGSVEPIRTQGHLLVIGFGPAGQAVVERLFGEQELPIVVLDLRPNTLQLAEAYELTGRLGDASRDEVLESVGIRTARAVAVTIPDPYQARHIVQRVRALSPDAEIFVRSRYHVHRWQLDVAGAHVVVDEEAGVGTEIAAAIRERVLGGGRRGAGAP